jgi:hypothetical protein
VSCRPLPSILRLLADGDVQGDPQQSLVLAERFVYRLRVSRHSHNGVAACEGGSGTLAPESARCPGNNLHDCMHNASRSQTVITAAVMMLLPVVNVPIVLLLRLPPWAHVSDHHGLRLTSSSSACGLGQQPHGSV